MASTSLVRRCKSLWIHRRHYSAGARKNTLPSFAPHLGPIPHIFPPGFNTTPHSVICPSLMIYPFLPKYKFINTESKGRDAIPSEKKSMKRVPPYPLYRTFRHGSNGTLLGLDVGPEVIKLSIVYPRLKNIAKFMSVIHRNMPMNSLAEEFKILISMYSIVGFVFGCDKKLVDSLDDKDNENLSVQVKRFVEDFSETGKLGEMKYAYWDNKFANGRIEYILGKKAKKAFEKIREEGLRKKALKAFEMMIRQEGPLSVMLQDFLLVNLERWHELGDDLRRPNESNLSIWDTLETCPRQHP